MCKLLQEFNTSEIQENRAKLYVQNVIFKPGPAHPPPLIPCNAHHVDSVNLNTITFSLFSC